VQSSNHQGNQPPPDPAERAISLGSCVCPMLRIRELQLRFPRLALHWNQGGGFGIESTATGKSLQLCVLLFFWTACT